MRTTPIMPIPVQSALQKLGKDLKAGRLRRRIPMQLMAERCGTTRVTLGKVEKGDPTVSLGIYASVLFVLGMISRLRDLVDANVDIVGRELEEERLPKRIRFPIKKNDEQK